MTTDNWDSTFQKLIDFLQTESRKPSSLSTTEIFLFNWLDEETKKYKKRMQEESRRAQWEQMLELYRPLFYRDDASWNKKYAELADFIRKHKRLPALQIQSEKQLFYWVQRQITERKMTQTNIVRKNTVQNLIQDVPTARSYFYLRKRQDSSPNPNEIIFC
jgi:hypothetical protein